MTFLHGLTPATTVGLLLMIVPTLTPAQAPKQNEPAKPPQQQQAKPTPPQDGKPGETNQMELFEDRTLTIVGRVVRKEDQMFLRIKAMPGMNPANPGMNPTDGQKPRSAGDAKDAKEKDGKENESKASAAGAQDPGGAAPQKRKTGTRKTLQLNDEIQLLRCAMLEDMEEDAGLKEIGKTDVEATPLLQVQGLLTMYRGQPYLLVQTYRTRTDLDTSRHDEKKGDQKKD